MSAHLDSMYPIWKLSSQSGNFPVNLETFQSIWTIYSQSGKFPVNLETSQSSWKLSTHPGNFPFNLESLNYSGNFSNNVKKNLENFVVCSYILHLACKNFPDVQTLSMWQCHLATLVFLSLHDPYQ